MNTNIYPSYQPSSPQRPPSRNSNNDLYQQQKFSQSTPYSQNAFQMNNPGMSNGMPGGGMGIAGGMNGLSAVNVNMINMGLGGGMMNTAQLLQQQQHQQQQQQQQSHQQQMMLMNGLGAGGGGSIGMGSVDLGSFNMMNANMSMNQNNNQNNANNANLGVGGVLTAERLAQFQAYRAREQQRHQQQQQQQQHMQALFQNAGATAQGGFGPEPSNSGNRRSQTPSSSSQPQQQEQQTSMQHQMTAGHQMLALAHAHTQQRLQQQHGGMVASMGPPPPASRPGTSNSAHSSSGGAPRPPSRLGGAEGANAAPPGGGAHLAGMAMGMGMMPGGSGGMGGGMGMGMMSGNSNNNMGLAAAGAMGGPMGMGMGNLNMGMGMGGMNMGGGMGMGGGGGQQGMMTGMNGYRSQSPVKTPVPPSQVPSSIQQQMAAQQQQQQPYPRAPSQQPQQPQQQQQAVGAGSNANPYPTQQSLHHQLGQQQQQQPQHQQHQPLQAQQMQLHSHGGHHQQSPPPLPQSPYVGHQKRKPMPGMESPRLGGKMMGPPLGAQQQQGTVNGGYAGVQAQSPVRQTSGGAMIQNGMGSFPEQPPRGGMLMGDSRTPQRPPTGYGHLPPQPPTPLTPTLGPVHHHPHPHLLQQQLQHQPPPPQLQQQQLQHQQQQQPRQPSVGLGSPQKGTPQELGMMGVMGPISPMKLSSEPRLSMTPTRGGTGARPATPLQPLVFPTSTLPPSAAPAAVAHPQQQQQQQAHPAAQALPATMNLNPAVTRVTLVPLADSARAIPPLSREEVTDVRGWMEADAAYEGRYRRMRERVHEEVRAVGAPARAPWWEREAVEFAATGARRRAREPFEIRYPRSRKEREGRTSRKAGRREGLRIPRRLSREDADRPEQLVPIRLEFDVEHQKMRDTFVWNINDPVVTPENFAQSVVDDYTLPTSYHSVIVKSIQDQLSDFKAHSSLFPDGDEGEAIVEDVLCVGGLSEEDVAWWESWRKRLRTPAGFVRSGRRKGLLRGRKRRKLTTVRTAAAAATAALASDTEWDEEEKPMDVGAFKLDEDQLQDDLRIVIKLDVIVGSMKLDDQFEWDVSNEGDSPEQFSQVYCKELGLGGEFKTAIAHCIREQVQAYHKSLFLVGPPSEGGLLQDEDLRTSFLPNLASGARSTDQVQSFTPTINYLSDGEIERNEKERDRDMTKRRKRNMRGRRGLALPDREPIRTYRTPAIGFPELDPATLAAAAAANAPTRRAAAAAASHTIANMIASENGQPLVMQTMPLPTQPTQIVNKEKKVKGLFKAPPVPSSVLHPRAQVTAPTRSTAADASSQPPTSDSEPPVSTTNVAAPDKQVRVVTAKRAKELEREAKEKEFADGQHPNFVDGIWHCSNCGCPESIAIGRRKGPLGDKSQCGLCGKFWHRHRRPRPVEYSRDPEFHMSLKRETEAVKTIVRKKGGAAALRAQNSAAATPGEGSGDPQTPLSRGDGANDASRTSHHATVPPEEDRAPSPASSTSSGSEPPLAMRVKLNGTNHGGAAPHSAPLDRVATPKRNASQPLESRAPTSAPSKPSWPLPPQWLTTVLKTMQAKYPEDKFEITLRKAEVPAQWRLKCLDCPGKLYTPGPNETLSNFEVHLKNRQHRHRVDDRLKVASAG